MPDMMARTLDILATLIAFDTTSRKSNLALIDWVEAFLDDRGIRHWRVPSADGHKANLLATIGPAGAPGIMLAGHTDVVPVDGQPWTSDPWVMTERDGRLYGRGTADMKAFIALSLAHLESPAMAGLTRQLSLALTYDEEVGCLGAPHLVSVLPDMITPPELVIVGEPTLMKVVSAHKGMRTFTVTVTGREAHSSQRGQGVSAIAEAVKLMALVGEMDAEAEAMAAPDLFQPSGATLTVGLVEGGTATNIMARQCVFWWDLRSADDAVADAFEARFRAAAQTLDADIKGRAPEGGVEIVRKSASPPLVHREDSSAETFVRSLTGDNGLEGASFVAEAGLYQRAGMPSVLCGPGSILQAHQPDEWIALDQIKQAVGFFDRLLARLSS